MLEVRIRKRIGDLDIHADFNVPGGITVLFGPSGSGKSSILKMIAGMLEPDSGEISISSRNLFTENSNLRISSRRTGFVFQDGLLFPHMTVRQNLQFAAAGGEAIESHAERFDLVPLLDRLPRSLSGGERQRVALARALLGAPECLLMDEPLASLDQRRKDAILPHLKRLRETQPLPILYVTHSIEETFRLADNIVLIEHGKTGLSGTPAAVFGTIPGDGTHNPLAGGLLSGQLIRHHHDEHLSEVRVAGSSIYVAKTPRDTGSRVRIRLVASDISIATEAPKGISILNRLPARISALVDRLNEGVGVSLELADGQRLVASVTTRAARSLKLQVGMPVHALFKTVAVTPENLD